MKKTAIISFLLLSIFGLQTICAQPSPVKKAAKSIFKITTFDAEGNILHTGYGAFVGADGTCIANWNAFVGASTANVIDGQGRKYDVDYLIGANDIYNVAKFRVIVPEGKKMAITPLTIDATLIPAGGNCWFVEYDVKNPAIKQYSPTKVETFSTELPYYIFEQTAPEELAGSPFLTDAGQLIGLMQPAQKRTDIYCPSAQFGMGLTVSALSANDPTIRQTNIRVGLPDDYNQATLALMMANSNFSSPSYLVTANDFVTRFPDKTDGYIAKADYYSAQNDIESAQNAMNECYEKCEDKAGAHFSYSKIIYNKVINSDSTFTAWTLDNAINEVDLAYSIDPQPIFTMQKAKTLFAQKKFEEAYNNFYSLRETNLRGSEMFYYASLCQQQLNAPDETILALLDSTVACFEKPYNASAATYLLIRGRWLDQHGMSRKALNDFNDYEQVMKQSLNDNFYYTREQIAMRAKLYQMALDDIDKAFQLNPREPLYLCEKALILVRVNHISEAIPVCQLSEIKFPNYGDSYAIHGLALILDKKKAEGMKLLEKAQSLGSELAPQFIETYGNK